MRSWNSFEELLNYYGITIEEFLSFVVGPGNKNIIARMMNKNDATGIDIGGYFIWSETSYPSETWSKINSIAFKMSAICKKEKRVFPFYHNNKTLAEIAEIITKKTKFEEELL